MDIIIESIGHAEFLLKYELCRSHTGGQRPKIMISLLKFQLMYLVFFVGLSCVGKQDVGPPAFSLGAKDLSRKISKLDANWSKEKLYKISSARVVIANYPLLVQDFPFLDGMGNDKIDSWLISNFAYLSENQIFKKNTDGSLSKERIKDTHDWVELDLKDFRFGFRPPQYGRAMIFPISNTGNTSGFVDVKGIGTENPRALHEKTGLAPLYPNLWEYLFENMLAIVLNHDSSDYSTIGIYAVFDNGFKMKNVSGRTDKERSSMVLRQAFHRHPGRETLFEPAASVAIERVLRQYGITSVGDAEQVNYEGREVTYSEINIQGASDQKTIIDFTHFNVLAGFDDYAGPSFVDHDPNQIAITPILQPDNTVRVPFPDWSRENIRNILLEFEELLDEGEVFHASQVSLYRGLWSLLEPVNELIGPVE